MPTVHHHKNGLFFERGDNGSVRIFKTKDWSPNGTIDFQTTIPALEWCEIVAQMSRAGPKTQNFDKAKELHFND